MQYHVHRFSVDHVISFARKKYRSPRTRELFLKTKLSFNTCDIHLNPGGYERVESTYGITIDRSVRYHVVYPDEVARRMLTKHVSAILDHEEGHILFAHPLNSRLKCQSMVEREHRISSDFWFDETAADLYAIYKTNVRTLLEARNSRIVATYDVMGEGVDQLAVRSYGARQRWDLIMGMYTDTFPHSKSEQYKVLATIALGYPTTNFGKPLERILI